jgi:HEAT repeat protein
MFERIKIFWIRYKLNLLGMADAVFPIEIFSLSRKIADLESKESAYRIIKQYECHPNFYVRRAALIAIRFMGEEATKKFLDTLLQRTSESEEWVCYDAVWALGESKLKDDRIPIALRNVAKEFANMSAAELEEFKPKEDSDYAKKRAAQSLHQYENN